MTTYVAAGAVEMVTAVDVESPFEHHLHTVSPLEAFDVYKRQTRSFLNAQAGDHLLDIGCGEGEDTRLLARLIGPAGRVVGLDTDSLHIAAAERRAATLGVPIEFHVGDAGQLPFDRDSFDLVRADRVLYARTDPGNVLDELVRVTRSHGRIVVGDLDWETLTVDMRDRDLTRRILHQVGQRYASSWIGRQLPAYFRDAGLRDIAIAPVSLIVTDYCMADYIFGLGMAAQEAQQTGTITAEEAHIWQRDLHCASQTGHFFSSITAFVVRGRKS